MAINNTPSHSGHSASAGPSVPHTGLHGAVNDGHRITDGRHPVVIGHPTTRASAHLTPSDGASSSRQPRISHGADDSSRRAQSRNAREGYGISRLTMQTMPDGQFDAAGPQSPAADLANFRLPASVDALEPYSWPYLQQTMQSLLRHVLDNVGGRWLPVTSLSARDAVRREADDLLNRIDGTHRDDTHGLQALRAEVVHFLDSTLLPNLATTRRGIPRFTCKGTAAMGTIRLSNAFVLTTVAGARNRIRRAGLNAAPRDLIGATIVRLSGMTQLLMAMHGGSWGQFNIGVAMFRIGRSGQGPNTVNAIAGTLVATSTRPGYDIETQMQGHLDRIRDRQVTGDLATRYATAIEALSDASFVQGDLFAELNSPTPTFPLLMRRGERHTLSGATDAEYRLLGNVLHEMRRQGVNPSQVTGHVYLFSQYPICGTCMLAVEAFKAQCPNIDVIAVQGSRYQLADEPLPPGATARPYGQALAYRLDDWIEAQTGDMPTTWQAAIDVRRTLTLIDEHDVPVDQSGLVDAAKLLLDGLRRMAPQTLSERDRLLLRALDDVQATDTSDGGSLRGSQIESPSGAVTVGEGQRWFHLPAQTRLAYDVQPQAGSSTGNTQDRIGQVITQGHPVTTLQRAHHALFIAGSLHAVTAQFAAGMNSDLDEMRPFVEGVLLAIVDHHAQGDASGSSATFQHAHGDGLYDVRYSVEGTQLMTLAVDEHVGVEINDDMASAFYWGPED